MLTRKGANPNIRANGGTTVLDLAMAKKNENLLRLLVQNGADVNMVNKEGETPLIQAIKEEQKNIFHILIQSEIIDPGAEDRDGWPPLYWALKKSQPGNFFCLVERAGIKTRKPCFTWLLKSELPCSPISSPKPGQP
jgi:ankyrin repeat protein